MFAIALSASAGDAAKGPLRRKRTFFDHFRKRDRVAGMVAAFLTSGGVVGFLTYVGAWLRNSYNMELDRIGLLFMVSGLAAVAASPLSGWVADHAGNGMSSSGRTWLWPSCSSLFPAPPWDPDSSLESPR